MQAMAGNFMARGTAGTISRKPSLDLEGYDARLPSWATPRNIMLALFLISLVVDLGFGFLLKFRPDPSQLDADELEYYKMASGMMAGTLEFTARRTLAFPLVLAAIRSVSENFLFLQAVMTAIFSLSAPLMFLVVRKVTRSIAVAGLVALALAIWPPIVFYGVSLYSEALALPVFLLALWALPCGSRTGAPRASRDWLQAVAAGVILALATQVRPMYLIMTPFMALIVLVEEADLRIAVRRLAILAAAFTLTTLPWSAYMTTRFHHPILVTSNGGETLAGAMNPVLLEPWAQRRALVGNRNVWVGPGKWLPVGQNGYLSKAERDLPYDQQDALLKARTMAWVKAHPGDAFRLEMAKFGYMWGVYPMMKNGPAQLLLGNLPTLALLALGLFGFVKVPVARTALVRFWILPFFVSAVAGISWGSWRFRQPGDAGLLAFTIVCLLILLAARRAARADADPALSVAAR